MLLRACLTQRHPSRFPPPPPLPQTPPILTEGKAREKPNNTGVRFWTDGRMVAPPPLMDVDQPFASASEAAAWGRGPRAERIVTTGATIGTNNFSR